MIFVASFAGLLAGAVVAADVVGTEHVALAVFGRAELAAATARTLPGHRHRAILARESGDVERLRHRRIVDLALVEALAGRVRGELEERADDHPAALVVERDDLVLGRARVAGGHRPQADGAGDGERFDGADQLAVGVLADFTDVHGLSPGRIDCDRTPCSITLFPPPFPPGRQAEAAGSARRIDGRALRELAVDGPPTSDMIPAQVLVRRKAFLRCRAKIPLASKIISRFRVYPTSSCMEFLPTVVRFIFRKPSVDCAATVDAPHASRFWWPKRAKSKSTTLPITITARPALTLQKRTLTFGQRMF